MNWGKVVCPFICEMGVMRGLTLWQSRASDHHTRVPRPLEQVPMWGQPSLPGGALTAAGQTRVSLDSSSWMEGTPGTQGSWDRGRLGF